MYSCCYIWFTNPFSLHGGFHSALLGDGGPDTSVTKLDDADVTRTVPRAPCVWFLVDLGSHLPAHFYIAFLFCFVFRGGRGGSIVSHFPEWRGSREKNKQLKCQAA